MRDKIPGYVRIDEGMFENLWKNSPFTVICEDGKKYSIKVQTEEGRFLVLPDGNVLGYFHGDGESAGKLGVLNLSLQQKKMMNLYHPAYAVVRNDPIASQEFTRQEIKKMYTRAMKKWEKIWNKTPEHVFSNGAQLKNKLFIPEGQFIVFPDGRWFGKLKKDGELSNDFGFLWGMEGCITSQLQVGRTFWSYSQWIIVDMDQYSKTNLSFSLFTPPQARQFKERGDYIQVPGVENRRPSEVWASEEKDTRKTKPKPKPSSNKTIKNIESDVQAGIKLISEKNYNESVKFFEKLINEDPLNPILYSYQGNCHAELGEHFEAMVNYTRALQLDKNNKDAWLGASKFYEEKEIYRWVNKCLSRIVSVDPTLHTKIDEYDVKAFAQVLQLEDFTWFDKSIETSKPPLRENLNKALSLFQPYFLAVNSEISVLKVDKNDIYLRITGVMEEIPYQLPEWKGFLLQNVEKALKEYNPECGRFIYIHPGY
ncbi:MAG: tetratricopeptide repeat protein [Promethearchaeota archaeon]